MDELDLRNRCALVTGASRGIGLHIALALASLGAHVILVARNAILLSNVQELIKRNNGTAVSIAADVSDPVEVAHLVERVGNAGVTPQIVVNAAGIFGPLQLIAEVDIPRWIETIQTNTIAPFLICRAFLPPMIAMGWGRIINVSSAAALHVPGPLNSAYGTSKVALNHFTRHMAAELQGTGVTANVIHPGDVKSDMWATIRDEVSNTGPTGDGYRQWARWVDETGGDPPDKAAKLVTKLISDDAKHINGQFLWIDGGLQKPIPSW